MHEERFAASPAALRAAAAAARDGRALLAVGTTAARAAESMYWLGAARLLTPALRGSGAANDAEVGCCAVLVLLSSTASS